MIEEFVTQLNIISIIIFMKRDYEFSKMNIVRFQILKGKIKWTVHFAGRPSSQNLNFFLDNREVFFI